MKTNNMNMMSTPHLLTHHSPQLFLFGLFFLLICGEVHPFPRQVTTTSWPNCEDFPKACALAKTKDMNVVYAKAIHKSNDNLYYAFSTVGAPTVVLARTLGKDRDFYFNYTAMTLNLGMNKVLSFKGDASGWTLDYKFGVAFTKLIEYDDAGDTADITICAANNASFIIKDFKEFSWFMDDKDVKKNSFMFRAESDYGLNETAGNITFSFSVRGDDGRNSDLPAMKFNSNLTQFDFEIDGVPPSVNNSRFAVEAMLSSLSTNKDMSMEQSRSIDDEYAPGVFLITDWLSNPLKKAVAGFMQWKPVAYFGKDRARKVVTKVAHYDLTNQMDKGMLKETFVYSLFGNDLWDQSKVLHRATNISFGLSKDGFYLKNNYTVWSAAVGYGTPPEDAISTTVIIIIAVGLGIPVVIMIFGGIYTCIRKSKRRHGEYEAIGEGVNRTNPQVN